MLTKTNSKLLLPELFTRYIFLYVTIKHNYNAGNYTTNKYKKILKNIEKKAPNLNTKLIMNYLHILISPCITQSCKQRTNSSILSMVQMKGKKSKFYYLEN